jgi:hypothetical protein
MSTRTITIDDEEQVVVYQYELDNLRRMKAEYSTLLERLKMNEHILRDMEGRGPTRAVYRTLDGLSAFSRDCHNSPVVYRSTTPSPTGIWGGGELPTLEIRAYRRKDDLETMNGIHAIYEEEARSHK